MHDDDKITITLTRGELKRLSTMTWLRAGKAEWKMLAAEPAKRAGLTLRWELCKKLAGKLSNAIGFTVYMDPYAPAELTPTTPLKKKTIPKPTIPA